MDPKYNHKCPYISGEEIYTRTHTYMGNMKMSRGRFEDAGLVDWGDVTASQGMLVVNRS